MSFQQHDPSLTSNDLLRRLIAKHAHVLLSDQTDAQSSVDTKSIEYTSAIGTIGVIQTSE